MGNRKKIKVPARLTITWCNGVQEVEEAAKVPLKRAIHAVEEIWSAVMLSGPPTHEEWYEDEEDSQDEDIPGECHAIGLAVHYKPSSKAKWKTVWSRQTTCRHTKVVDGQETVEIRSLEKGAV